jgi:hypothetical protein
MWSDGSMTKYLPAAAVTQVKAATQSKKASLTPWQTNLQVILHVNN